MIAFADLVTKLWAFAAYLLFSVCWLNGPVLFLFLIHRLAQRLDRRFELRPTTPTHGALHYYCALFFGVLLPCFYFLTVRTRSSLAEFWRLGPLANNRWTILLGVICLTWLLARLLEAALRLERPRFGARRADLYLFGAALLLCLWFHANTIFAAFGGMADQAREFPNRQPWETIMGWFAVFMGMVYYPQTCFFGATLVYGGAFFEARRFRKTAETAARAAPAFGPHWPIALTAAVTLSVLLFAPFWLSIPRVSHRQALTLLETHHDQIVRVSKDFELDPALLAGIIYVAQTRDHPRWIGDSMEEATLRMWNGTLHFGPRGGSPLINASAGLCQIRPDTAAKTCYLILRFEGLGSDASGQVYLPSQWQRIATTADIEHVLSVSGAQFPRSRSALIAVTREAASGNMDRLLLRPQSNLALAGAILTLCRLQWERAGFPIDDRPDILATLYNIGFEHSRPHDAPRANDFGRRVLKFMESETCRELFPTPPE